ncbi:probable glycoprotein hormone G-protein coupled receptor [Penaeus indicus]|uniref:probable glycoprotein hormone G-protein coupled receptor n=1 Tax=Penaeus indicus TaxID=29960 RepID=UPI00300C22A3
MKGVKVAILCCLLVAVWADADADADADAQRGRNNRRRGNARFFGGGLSGGGFPGGGGFGGGGFPGGGGFGGGGFPGGGGFGGGGFPGGGLQAQCRYWCRTPEGQAYCCEGAQQPQRPVGTKFGQCPPVRPTCPQTRFGPPQTCSNDYNCAGRDKCCFDRCLGEHVCKPPSSFGFFG